MFYVSGLHCILDSSASPADTEARIAALEHIALDLMMEVESLRMAVLELTAEKPSAPVDDVLAEDGHGVPGPHSIYGKAYIDAGWESHCSVGPSCGAEKILGRFYSLGQKSHDLREVIMLRRLGYTDEAIAKYVDQAMQAETYS
jgi:hypothetical protein